jgi:hypothetical protein
MESVTNLMLETTEVYFTISESTPLFNSPRVVWVHELNARCVSDDMFDTLKYIS